MYCIVFVCHPLNVKLLLNLLTFELMFIIFAVNFKLNDNEYFWKQ